MVSWTPSLRSGRSGGLFQLSGCWLLQDPRLGGNIACPWHEYVPSNGYFAGVSLRHSTFTKSRPDKLVHRVSARVLEQRRIRRGWSSTALVCSGGTTTPFHFEFGVKGEYGAPRDLDGMVPQVYATWVNGLLRVGIMRVRGPSAMSSRPWMVPRSKSTTLT